MRKSHLRSYLRSSIAWSLSPKTYI